MSHLTHYAFLIFSANHSVMSPDSSNPLNQDTKSVELIAEIEESGQEPKKIIGDIVNLFLADQVRVKGKDYWLGDVVLVLGVRSESRGKARARVMGVREKLMDMNALLKRRNMTIIPVFDRDLAELVSKVRDKIEFELARLDETPKRQVPKQGRSSAS